ncbi:coiled coil domain-containing protein [Nitrosomonas aestuarii]|uniref:Coiled coil domain-containing protein n=1 Tax=Nitrosomonas aestuarii TaxID=52441 RepID=A0A1I4AKG8_9PROT|nr:coiled coil domain-containing protein [Nitrosomonas aestuarii]PTN13238.1 hypothetical protein C8R11_101229 [Nitrosomonas aestuarii]SFK56968.1 hypothetical protein SAMN05216302_100980 [Nitrosomonas aestuarii]
MTDKEAYLQKMQAKLDEWDADINALKAKMSGASADAKIELNKQVESLESERNEMKQKYEELKSASGDAWKDMRDGMEAAWSRVADSFKKASDRFK